ncbi:cell division protein FtsK [Streptomyces sp. NPDC047049]|uniref:cell division protein FtsK n=1 Tax=Streptomyces sp. NPDC047049 TaxID=3156688 RepID=UPI0033FD559F
MTCAQTSMPIEALRQSVHLVDAPTVNALQHTHQVLLGLADGDRPVYLPTEAGNILVATGAGGGTTTVLRTLAAQALHHGAHVDILDIGQRRPSHQWAASLPGVLVHSSISEVHNLLVEMLDRLRHQDAVPPADWRRRRILVIEHTDRLLYGLRQHWALTRPESQLEDAPGVEALGMLLVAGPHAGLQIAAGSTHLPPRLDAAVSDVFPTRVLAYAGQTLWARIAPEVWPVPPYSVIPGRMHAVQDGRATRFQALYLSESQARAWARGTVPKEYR